MLLFFLLLTSVVYYLVSCRTVKAAAGESSKSQGEAPLAKKPNIILIVTDDHAYQAISAYGSKLNGTPNIDRIANEGALMTEACVTNSVCSASRAVILTGKYSHINGLKDNGTFFNGAQETFPKILQRNGYRTAVIGKWHLWSDPTGFDYWNILPAQGHYYNPPFVKMGKDTAYKGYITDVTTDLSLDWIEKNKNNPFCLLLFHKAPHRNWMPPLKYLDMFNNKKFPLPGTFYDKHENRLALQRQLITVSDHLDVRYDSKIPCDSCAVTPINDWAPGEYQKEIERLTPAERKVWDAAYAKEYDEFKKLKTKDEIVRWQFQRYMEDYLRCVQSVDDNVGRVLQYLDDSKLADNTIVIYMSDQGFYLGEHGLYDKRFMYKESFRTPMMIRYPAAIPAKQKLPEYTLNLDIAPTLLDLAGIPVPSDMQGESMKPLLVKGSKKDKKDNWRKEVYYHYYEVSFGLTKHYGIRTPDYKLIHFYDPIDSWELYDLKKDPDELKNLYNDTAYSNVIADLKMRLKKLQEKYKDDVKK
ncbi:sulfatase [Parasegetibacter sp. MAH-26]|uniref:Sulfatase n=2 Tax=Pinibacter aurantiacus TaxID=2851599 RepID=A0A9E2S7X1_9BACT|nr:sulfatase [Pinibacter aurantiacus]